MLATALHWIAQHCKAGNTHKFWRRTNFVTLFWGNFRISWSFPHLFLMPPKQAHRSLRTRKSGNLRAFFETLLCALLKESHCYKICTLLLISITLLFCTSLHCIILNWIALPYIIEEKTLDLKTRSIFFFFIFSFWNLEQFLGENKGQDTPPPCSAMTSGKFMWGKLLPNWKQF